MMWHKMKKNVIALCIGLFSASAFAQNTVTIYGVVDAGLTATKMKHYDYTNGQIKKSWRTGVDSGNVSASRIGVKGSEDLGQGTSVIFNLEAGFNMDDGIGGDAYSSELFGRRAVVGLRNDQYGELTLGRQDSVFHDAMKNVDPLSDRNQYSDAAFITYDSMLNNALVYSTPNWHGISGKLNYAFGENAGSAKSGRFYGASLHYAANNLNLNFAYGHSDYAIDLNALTIGSHATTGVYNFYRNWIGGYIPSSRKQYMLTASYDMGIAKPFAVVTTSKTETPAMGANLAYFKEKSAKLGVTVPFGASSIIASAGYTYIKPKALEDKRAWDYTFTYTYDFSKRTSLYALIDVIKEQNSPKNAFYVTQHEGYTELAVGIRHRF